MFLLRKMKNWDFPKPDLGTNIGLMAIKISENYPKGCISFPIYQFYILVKIS